MDAPFGTGGPPMDQSAGRWRIDLFFSERAGLFLLLWASFFCDAFLCFALHAMGLRFLLSFIHHLWCERCCCEILSHYWVTVVFGNGVCIKKRIPFLRVCICKGPACLFSFQPACYEFLGFYALYYIVPCMIVTWWDIYCCSYFSFALGPAWWWVWRADCDEKTMYSMRCIHISWKTYIPPLLWLLFLYFRLLVENIVSEKKGLLGPVSLKALNSEFESFLAEEAMNIRCTLHGVIGRYPTAFLKSTTTKTFWKPKHTIVQSNNNTNTNTTNNKNTHYALHIPPNAHC